MPDRVPIASVFTRAHDLLYENDRADTEGLSNLCHKEGSIGTRPVLMRRKSSADIGTTRGLDRYSGWKDRVLCWRSLSTREGCPAELTLKTRRVFPSTSRMANPESSEIPSETTAMPFRSTMVRDGSPSADSARMARAFPCSSTSRNSLPLITCWSRFLLS